MSEDEVPASIVARRVVTSSVFQIGSQAVTLITGMVRAILLGRLLMPEDYGLVTLAILFSNLVWNTTALGIDSRLIQRRQVDQELLGTHLALRASLAVLAFFVLLAATPLLRATYPNQMGLDRAVLALGGLNVLKAFNMTPYVLLKRRLAFRRLAIIGVASSLTMLVVAPLMAWYGCGFWSLVIGEQVTGTLVSTLGLWAFHRPMPFSIRIGWAAVKDYVGFGRFVVVTHQLRFALDRFDDFWAGTALGGVALGYYSKAYEFATYPRKIISRPLQDIFFAAYSRLQDDRRNLSKAFFRANSYVVRMGFLFTSLLVIVAPEFVEVLLGSQWLPMVSTFQLMVVYSLFDPLLLTAGNLLTACGAPQKLTRVRAVQLVFFAPAVVAGASLWGIEGIAVAADIMLLVGILYLFRLTSSYVDISLRKLLMPPTLGLLAGATTAVTMGFVLSPCSLLVVTLAEAIGFTLPYVATLLLLEREQYKTGLQALSRLVGLSGSMRRSRRHSPNR